MAGRRYFRLMTILAAVFATIGVSLHTSSVASAASATCPNGSTMAVVAHEDDTLLFINPDILNDIQSGKCVQTVIMTAGDSGAGQSYWGMREQGTEAAYAEMAGVPNTWTQSDPGISGHPMQLMTLSGNPRVSLIFMQLPDGNFDGSGFPSTNNQSLQKLYTGSINQINAIDGSTSYTKPQLISTLTQLMQQFSPDKIYTQDFVGAYGDGDHSDHHTVAYLTRDASRAWTTATHTLIGYMDYASANQPANVSGNALTQKYNAYFAYAPYDGNVCQSVAACNQNGYGQWLQRQYTVGSEVDGPGSNNPPIANAGANQFVSPGSTVQLDGSGSYDPNGNPTYNWTQTAGPSVTLSSPTAVKPTFTAPSDSATLTFQLVVTDGQLSSQPSTVTVTVTPAGSNIAPQATVTASSQNTATGQLATKAVDGVIDGYPGDYTKEWATVGGGANSWLNLQWNNAFTVSKVILYDRPNLDDQITGATLKFSDGTVVQVPALNNDGSATVVTFPAVTTSSLLMTVTSVSSNTQNIGLAEIQVFPVSSANTGPSVTSTTPSSLAQGAANQNVTINGTGFLNGAVATFSNPGITVNSTTFNSATQLIANVSVAPGASTGPADVTVTNPDGSTTTASGAFTVNAAPTVTSTSPSALGQGTANQNVTINGTNFEPGATASFGAGITVNSTTFNSATQLTANITIAAGASLGARDVTVTNPDAGVGTGKGIFTVNAPTLTVTSASPSSGDVGATNYSVMINGTGFQSGATVAFGAGITVNSATFVDSSHLGATITIPAGASTGPSDVTVTNPDGSTATGSGAFTVNAAPTVTSASPNSGDVGATNYNVTINGTNFESAASVSFGAGITVNSTTFNSATRLTANINIPAGASLGARDVTVTNPDGSSATGSGAFTVNAAPTVTSASPSSGDVGATNYNVTVNGTNFESGATATFGAGVTVNSTTYVDSSHLTANITIPAGTSTGGRTVTVTNPDGSSATGSGAFTVNAAPTVTSASPNSADVGATNYNVTINGTNFESGATASFGAGITVNSTTFNSSTRLTANITIPAGTSTGARTVTVTNPDGSTATRSGAFTVNAAPTVTSASPSSADVGATNYNVTINGTGFQSAAGVSFGAGITVNSTTFNSSTRLTANITIPAGTSTGARTVTVTNPDGSTATRSGAFTVNAAPTVTSASPSSADVGATSYAVTINGTNFESGASVSFGAGITVNSTTFNSATQLTARITVTSSANTGPTNVTVTNPDGTTATGSAAFTVNGPPTITFPTATAQEKVTSATTASFSITGTNFESGARVSISGNGFGTPSVTFVSSTQLNVSVRANRNTGTFDLTVTNPDGSTVVSTGAMVNQAVAAAAFSPAAAPPASAASCVRIYRIYYNSPGPDTGSNASLNAEWISLYNHCASGRVLKAWTIKDAAGHKYTFGAYTLGGHKTVRVHTGSGKSTATSLFWGRAWYVWNNDADTAYLRDPSGTLLDKCSYNNASVSSTKC